MQKNVADFLVSQGIARSRIEYTGFAKEFPFDSRHTKKAWENNHRVHIATDKISFVFIDIEETLSSKAQKVISDLE